MDITGRKLFVKALQEEGVDTIFAYPGGMVTDIVDELYKQDSIHVVLPRHEQALIHEAEGYAKATGRVGVCLVTSGPGATNTITGIADAHYDSIPLVIFTGQVPQSLIGNDAFQEVDIVGMTRSIVKYGVTVRDRKDLGKIIKMAFHIASSGKPGPVLIDIPKDIQTQIDVTFRTAYAALQKANMEIGIAFVQQIACTVPIENSIRIKTRSVMGTEIPLVEYDKTSNTPTYAYYSTKMSLDEAKAAFEKVKELSIRLSMVENAAIRLAANIKKTQKRANALKNITIPKYEALTKNIQNALEEKEREEFTRLKVIKRMKQK